MLADVAVVSLGIVVAFVVTVKSARQHRETKLKQAVLRARQRELAEERVLAEADLIVAAAMLAHEQAVSRVWSSIETALNAVKQNPALAREDALCRAVCAVIMNGDADEMRTATQALGAATGEDEFAIEYTLRRLHYRCA